MNNNKIAWASLILVIIGIAFVIIGNSNQNIEKMYPIAVGDLLMLVGLAFSIAAIKNKIAWITLVIFLSAIIFGIYDYYSNQGPSAKEVLDKYNSEHPR